MNPEADQPLSKKAILVALTTTVIMAIGFYFVARGYFISEAKGQIRNLLLTQKGMHHYVQKVMHPALYNYKKEGEIPEKFYAPELFSSSFIVRNMHNFYNEERVKAGQPEVYYKMAAFNPRNPVNKADFQEEKLIRMFNQDRDLKEFQEIQKRDGKTYLYYAIPFLENTKACLVCHGKREDAPLQLRTRYKGMGGFNEKVGDIRAIISVRAPFEKELSYLYIFLAASTTGLLLLLGLLFISSYLRQKVHSKTRQLTEEVAERRKTEVALAEGERKYRRLLETINAVPWELDLASRHFTYMGPQSHKIFGYPASFWTDFETWRQTLHPDDRDRAAEFCLAETAAGRDHDFTYRAIHADGSIVWIHDIVSVVNGPAGPEKLIGFMHDITAEKRAEEEKNRLEVKLSQAYKMEAIGTLAGGIAHDFNNILAIILGYTELAIDDLPPDSRIRTTLNDVLKAGIRAKQLVQQILSFSRKSDQDLRPIHPHVIVKETIKLLRSTIPTTIEINSNIDPECGTIIADPTQIHQILINLAVNSVQAMQEKGVLTINLNKAVLDEQDLMHRPDMIPGNFVRLSVSDTGSGLDPAIRERIFEPFFTTKGVGEGTGLGLSVVHGIVMAHHGLITVDSTPGQGTTFAIYFAAAEDEEISLAESIKTLPTGTERILMIDDEEMVVTIGKRMLERQGYRVTTRSSSIEALEVFKEDPAAFDLVITDQAMPEMSGVELTGELLQIRPDLPIILSTGYTSKVSIEDIDKSGVRKLLMKPYDRNELVTAAREVLDEGKNPPGDSG